jgi:hypothetical protein
MMAKRKLRGWNKGKAAGRTFVTMGSMISLWKRSVPSLEALKKKKGTRKYHTAINQIIREKKARGE